MSLLVYPDLTGSINVNVSVEKDEYIINASANVIYTLPTITCNGMRFIFTRIDSTSNSVTLMVNPLSSDFISEEAGFTVTSVLIESISTVEVQSYEGIWYLFYRANVSSLTTPFFNTSFIGNSGADFISGIIRVIIPFLGTNAGDTISSFYIVRNGTFPTVSRLYKENSVGFQTLIAAIPATPNPGGINTIGVNLTPSQIALLPTGTSEILIYTYDSATGNHHSLLIF